jgi:hypothetical protein
MAPAGILVPINKSLMQAKHRKRASVANKGGVEIPLDCAEKLAGFQFPEQ